MRGCLVKLLLRKQCEAGFIRQTHTHIIAESKNIVDYGWLTYTGQVAQMIPDYSRVNREKAESIARNLLELGSLSNEEIAKSTGLSVNEVQKLSNLQFV